MPVIPLFMLFLRINVRCQKGWCDMTQTPRVTEELAILLLAAQELVVPGRDAGADLHFYRMLTANPALFSRVVCYAKAGAPDLAAEPA